MPRCWTAGPSRPGCRRTVPPPRSRTWTPDRAAASARCCASQTRSTRNHHRLRRHPRPLRGAAPRQARRAGHHLRLLGPAVRRDHADDLADRALRRQDPGDRQRHGRASRHRARGARGGPDQLLGEPRGVSQPLAGPHDQRRHDAWSLGRDSTSRTSSVEAGSSLTAVPSAPTTRTGAGSTSVTSTPAPST
mgnify:CR=1 FL=1